eukprot:scaffold40245_cov18-Prasinocladus_malaysianus.AAC.1
MAEAAAVTAAHEILIVCASYNIEYLLLMLVVMLLLFTRCSLRRSRNTHKLKITSINLCTGQAANMKGLDKC